MLRVVYQASQDLEPGQIVDIQESHGRVDVKIRSKATAEQYIPELNAKLADFVSQCGWFQIWRGQIISAASPDSPLVVQYVADETVSIEACVQIREDCGDVRLHINPNLPPEILVCFLNPAIEKFLAGKQWFQLWQGEIVTMDSPERALV